MNRPDDYLFFPEEKDLSKAEKDAKSIVTQIMEKAGISEQLIYAFNKTGRLVTTENRHCLPKEVLDEWYAAIQEYRSSHRLNKKNKK